MFWSVNPHQDEKEWDKKAGERMQALREGGIFLSRSDVNPITVQEYPGHKGPHDISQSDQLGDECEQRSTRRAPTPA
jgi:hypothetical protein